MFPSYRSFLEQILTPPRLKHTLGVVQVMEDLAERYGFDREKARLAGLLHDAGKDLSPEQQKNLIEEGNISLLYPEERNYNLYLHGPVGAYFVRKEFGVDDGLILDAIAMHTYCGRGENWNDPLVWCLRFSDLLEPNRDWRQVRWMHESVPGLRQLAYNGRIWEAALLQTTTLIDWFDAEGMPVHPHMRQARQELALLPKNL